MIIIWQYVLSDIRESHANATAIEILTSHQMCDIALDLGLVVIPFSAELIEQRTGMSGALRVRFSGSHDDGGDFRANFNITLIDGINAVQDTLNVCDGAGYGLAILVKKFEISIECNFARFE